MQKRVKQKNIKKPDDNGQKEIKNNSDIKPICIVCSKDIDNKTEKYVQLSTYNIPEKTGEEKDKHTFYHWFCFLDAYKQNMNERIKETLSANMSQLNNIIKNLTQNIKPV